MRSPDPNHTATIAATFDQLASRYETYRLADWYTSLLATAFQWITLKPGGRVLDIGCATGWLLRQLAIQYPNVQGTGVDLSYRMIEQAHNLAALANLTNLTFKPLDWEHDDIQTFNFRHRFDMIVCASTLHYFIEPIEALKKMRSCLSPSGKLLLLERDKSHSALTILWDILHRYYIKDAVQFHSTLALKGFLNQAGFPNIHVKQRIRKLFWKKKVYTSMVWLEATTP